MLIRSFLWLDFLFSEIFGLNRNTSYISKMKDKKIKEKRVVKSYKVPLSIYDKCDKKAKKKKTTVANLLEDYLYDFAE